mmetsp:Transcript_30163/g.33698  ORF Transcript_30163/g.33698 Transcript_30163/m.33698 type:complete len:789 (-) Transcript_30163:44-2410(-)
MSHRPRIKLRDLKEARVTLTRSLSKTVYISPEQRLENHQIEQIRTNPDSRVTLCVTKVADIKAFMRPIMFFLMENELSVSIVTVAGGQLKQTLNSLSFLKGTTRFRLFVTTVTSTGEGSVDVKFLNTAMNTIEEADMLDVPIMVYAPNVEYNNNYPRHKNITVCGKSENTSHLLEARDDMRFQRFFGHATIVWIHEAKEILMSSQRRDNSLQKKYVKTFNSHGVFVQEFPRWTKATSFLNSITSIPNPFLRLVATTSRNCDPDTLVKFCRAIRSCLNVEYPILAYVHDLLSVDSEIFTYPYVKVTEQKGDLVRYALMKPLLWAPDVSKGLFEVPEKWKGQMSIYDITLAHVRKKVRKNGKAGHAAPYVKVLLDGNDMWHYKTKPTFGPTDEWQDLNWQFPVSLATKVEIVVTDWNMFKGNSNIGKVAFDVRSLMEQLPKSGSMSIQKTFKLESQAMDEVKTRKYSTKSIGRSMGKHSRRNLSESFGFAKKDSDPKSQGTVEITFSFQETQMKNRRRSGHSHVRDSVLGNKIVGSLRMKVHGKRASLFSIRRRSQKTQNGRYFGVTLEESMATALRDGSIHIIEGCCKALEKRGFNLEGLIRVPGNGYKIKQLRTLVESRQAVNYDAEDPYDLIGLLKLYLTELPDSFLPTENFKRIISKEYTSKSINKEFELLTQQRRKAWSSIVRYFLHLERHSKVNKMTFHNISVSISTTLLLPKNGTDMAAMAIMAGQAIEVLEFILTNADTLFPNATKSLIASDVQTDVPKKQPIRHGIRKRVYSTRVTSVNKP